MLGLPRTAHYAACACALTALTVVLGACAGFSPQAGPSAPLQAQSSLRGASSQSDLLYIGNRHTMEVYAYPGGTFESKFQTKFPIGAMCSDTKGDVFVSPAYDAKAGDAGGFVYEYSHGGTSPVATLDLPKQEMPVNCSSDPTSGNLAVTSYNVKTFAPQVQIYAGASGTAKTYLSKALGESPQPAYDAAGNLFVTSGGNVGALLAKGSQSFEKITLNVTLGGVAHAQWDGTYFALQSFTVPKRGIEKILEHVYRVKISGSAGTIVSVGQFAGWLEKDAGQSWLEGGTLVATPGAAVAFWNYPAGGKVTKVIHPSRPGKAVTVSTEQ
jgi:hypothetical protein